MRIEKLLRKRQRIKSAEKMHKMVDYLEQNEHLSHISKYKRTKKLLEQEKAILRMNGGNYYN